MNPSNKETDCFTKLKTSRFKNPESVIMGQLDINSLRNKFESIKLIISPNFYILLVSETKLDEPFPNNQLFISVYKMFRQDKTCFHGGLCTYIKENITSKQLNLHLDKETEVIYLKINIRLRKWLIVGLCKPSSQNNSLFFRKNVKNLSRYRNSFENITLLGDFDMNREDKNVQF